MLNLCRCHQSEPEGNNRAAFGTASLVLIAERLHDSIKVSYYGSYKRAFKAAPFS
jgi:hypothetical protein